MKTPVILLLLCGCIFQFSCKKKTQGTLINHGKIVVAVTHQVDGAPVVFDTAVFTNAAANQYSIEKLEYYLSDFRIYKNSQLCYSGTEIVLVNGRDSGTFTFNISPSSGLASGIYDSVAFTIGVSSVLNVSYGLPNTLDNMDMAWPDVMGGGYHFFKLEGHYKNAGLLAGYAMHLGQNGYQVNAGMHCSINIKPTGDATLNMIMNVNEWFRNPANYNFNTDGVFTMGDTLLMHKLALNGADVFFTN